MSDKTYSIVGRGFTLNGTIDEARFRVLVRALECAAGKICSEPSTVGAQKVELEVSDHEAYGAMVRTTETR